MAVGNATVSVGGGTALLTLPDVSSFVTLTSNAGNNPALQTFELSDDFSDEIGWNVNASIATPMGANKTVSLNGFWANINDKDSKTCIDGSPTAFCELFPIVDNPATSQTVAPGESLVMNTEREVDQWGVSLESKWTLNPGVMGVTRAPHKHYFALGADVRGINQDLAVDLRFVNAGGGPATYTESLDTSYYGAYAAWGGDYSLPFLSGMASNLGLQSSFLLRGGVYYADTDYDGRLIDATTNGATSALSLSDDDVAFIGGLVLETKKRIGQRATLSLKSEYEYYSYVPEMAYNTVDVGGGRPLTTGRQNGTIIGSDSAFSARTMLRLTIKLGPDSIMEPLK